MAETTLFVGTDRGLFRLVPDGHPVPCGPGDTSIRAVAIDCHEPTHMMAGGRHRPCLIESCDGGKSWKERSDLPDLEVWSLLLHHGVAMAGTAPPAIFRFEESWREFAAIQRLPGRSSWNFFPPDPPHVLTMQVQDDLIVAGIEMGGLIRSRNGGETWEEIGKEVNEDVHRIYLDHRNRDHLLVGAADGLYESRDGGDHWTLMAGTENFYVHAIAVHREKPDTVYLHARGGPILRSRDGQSWERFGRKLPRPDYGVDALDVDVFEPDTLYYGAEDTIYRSTDAGQTWSPIAEGLPKIRRVRAFLPG